MSKNYKQEDSAENAPLVNEENPPKAEEVKEKAETKADHKPPMPVEVQQERQIVRTALRLNKVAPVAKPALMGAIEQLINDNAGNAEFISALHQLLNCFGSLHMIFNALAVHHKQTIKQLDKKYPTDSLAKLKEIIYG